MKRKAERPRGRDSGLNRLRGGKGRGGRDGESRVTEASGGDMSAKDGRVWFLERGEEDLPPLLLRAGKSVPNIHGLSS
jgi:hypothetical protein